MHDAVTQIFFHKADLVKITQHATRCMPEEVCGILGGKNGNVQMVIPTTNILHSLVRFQIDPNEQLKIFEQLERKGLDMLAVYHSHPVGPANPSQMDIDNHFYPESAVIIISNSAKWEIKAFRVENGKVEKILIEIA